MCPPTLYETPTMPSVTINFDAAQATRLQDALTESLELETPAGVADLKNYIVSDLKQFVRSSEKRVARKVAESTISDVEIT